ncbi:hypothetical protein BB14905_06403 [Bacillus sp. B14905]|nr:hypothetical protein BB14905_06403 [Bacillus sp. B14905]
MLFFVCTKFPKQRKKQSITSHDKIVKGQEVQE